MGTCRCSANKKKSVPKKYLASEKLLSEIKLFEKDINLYNIQESQLYNILIRKLKVIVQKKYNEKDTDHRIILHNIDLMFKDSISFEFDKCIEMENNNLLERFEMQKILILSNVENENISSLLAKHFNDVLKHKCNIYAPFYILNSSCLFFFTEFPYFNNTTENTELFKKLIFPNIFFSPKDIVISRNLLKYRFKSKIFIQNVEDVKKNYEKNVDFYFKNMDISLIIFTSARSLLFLPQMEKKCQFLICDASNLKDFEKFWNMYLFLQSNCLFLYEKKSILRVFNFISSSLMKKLNISSNEFMDYIFKVMPALMNKISEKDYLQTLLTNPNEEENEFFKYISQRSHH